MVAFSVVFGVFVVAFVVLAVVTLRWALRRDRAGRAQWVRRREDQAGASGTPGSAGTPRTTSTNGKHPRSERSGERPGPPG